MSVNVGGVVATVGAKFDDDGFDRWERRVEKARRDARIPVETDLRADVDTSGFRKYERELDDTEGKSRKFAGKLGGAMKFGAAGVVAGAAVAGTAIAGLGVKFIDTASDIEESLTKNQVLFGNYAKDVQKFAETSATSFGISKQQALEYTGTFGNLARAIGISQKDSAGIAVDLTKQAADMASFNNTTIEEALDSLRSGLVGETEPLRKYGVTLTAAKVEAQAMAMGLKDGKKPLDDQAKAHATLALITKQTAAAQGDFARTSDGLANQQRILKARLSDAGAELGEKLLPVALKVARGLNRLLDQGDKVKDGFDRIKGAVRGFVDGLRSGEGGAGDFARKARENFNSVREFVVTTFDRIKRIFRGTGDDFRKFAEGIGNVIEVVHGTIARMLPGLSRSIEGIAKIIRGLVRIVGGILTGDWSRAWDGAKDVVVGALDGVRGTAESLLGALRPIFNKIGDVIGGAMSQALGIIADVVDAGSKLPFVGDKFDGMADKIRAAQRRIDKTRESFRDADGDARKGARGVKVLGDRVTDVGDVSRDTAKAIGGDLNEVLKGIGAKPVRFTFSQARASGAGVRRKAVVDDVNTFAVGGVPNPGSGAADDHVLLDPSGQPVALMSGTEGIVNTPQMGILDTALGIASAVTGGSLPRSLGEMWGKGLRHYAGGGQIVPVPGFPGERAAASVISKITQIARTYDLTLTDAFGPGHKSPGHTKYGTAADFAGSDANMDRAVAGLVQGGYKVLYDGRFGSTAYPGHGPSSVAGGNAHLHVELGAGGGSIGTMLEKILAPVIGGPAGPFLDALRGSAKKMAGAANRYASNAYGALPLGDHGSSVGRYNAGSLAQLWRQENPGNGDPRLMGAVGMAESAGDPAANGPPDGRGLWQVEWPIWGKTLGRLGNPYSPRPNARMAGEILKQQGIGAWVAFTNGSYRKFLNRGGLLGGLRRFAGGGKIGDVLTRGTNGSSPYDSMRSLRSKQGDRIGEYDDQLGALEDYRKRYEQTDRRYGQSVEVLIDEKSGAVNVAAVKRRALELGRLQQMREKIKERLEKMRVIAERVVETYRTIIGRLTRSLGHAKKKDRGGIRSSIKRYQENLGEWKGKLKDLGFDVTDADMDVTDIRNERAEVLGTQAEVRDTGSGSGDLGGDLGDELGTGVPDVPTAEPDVDQVARAEQAEANALRLEQDLAATRGNLTAFTGSGDLGAGGSSAWGAVTRGWPGGGPGAGAGGPIVNVSVASFVPPNGAELRRMGDTVVTAIASQPSRPSTREVVG